MYGSSSRQFSDGRWRLTDAQTGWLLLGVGTLALVGAVLAIRSGRMTVWYRKWGASVPVELDRSTAPILFSWHVATQVAGGFLLVFLGLHKLLVE